jgi:hypothetical protein
MSNNNIANVKAPKAPNLPIPTISYSQTYFEVLTNVLRLYFNQLDKYTAALTTPDIGYYLNQPYGGFSDNTTQTIAVINTAQAITFNTTDISDGPQFTGGQPDIYIDPVHTSRIVILYPGVYNFQFSLQIESTNASAKTVYVWPRLNGINPGVSNSATKITLSGSNSFQVLAWNFVLETFVSGEYFELLWAADSLNVRLVADPAPAAYCPAIPSAILTVTHASA